MKDPRDAARQTATVEALLDRFFNDDPDRRYEIQILADEVGMGKTFVALAVAYSILSAMRDNHSDGDLDGCYQRVLIITPSNQALFDKWQREVGEFVKRCGAEKNDETRHWFAPLAVNRIDDLSAELRTPGQRPRVLIATMSLFAGTRLKHYDLKRRFLLAALFRYWGNRFQYDLRHNLLKGAPADWPRKHDELSLLSENEKEVLPFTADEICDELRRLDEHDTAISGGLESIEQLRDICRQIAEPYQRNRNDLFKEVEKRLTAIYKAVTGLLILKSFPLVIVDEAHNWKNGPSKGANGYKEFVRYIASRARRALLLTATPFQLRPEEMMEILKVSDEIVPSSKMADAALRRIRLERFRENFIRPTLKKSESASRKFAKEWARLPSSVSMNTMQETWLIPRMDEIRRKIAKMANGESTIPDTWLQETLQDACSWMEPDLRPFLREALKLYAHNLELSLKLGALVIRHRRGTEHRFFKVGGEYGKNSSDVLIRPDRHLLHAAPGLDVRGDGELPHYTLMRCVTEANKAKGRKGRSSLGAALTGCYSTLLYSAEGKDVQNWLESSKVGKVYLALLMDMVSENEDENHPKMKRVVEEVVSSWRRGEKSLIFCFRVNTAKRLQEIIDQNIRKEIEDQAGRCLGGRTKLETLRGRLTRRDQDLVTIGLDRVLWSLMWAEEGNKKRNGIIRPSYLEVKQQDIEDLAKLSLQYGVPVTGERVDRVFINRAVEHIIAKRLLRIKGLTENWRTLLNAVSKPEWVARPYGLNPEVEEDAGGDETPSFDERGVHTAYNPIPSPSEEQVRALAKQIRETRRRAEKTAQVPIINNYAQGASLWFGDAPSKTYTKTTKTNHLALMLSRIHRHLWSLSHGSDKNFDWESRRKVLHALRKAVFRNSVLLRILPTQADREESSWGQMLVQSFFRPMPDQKESVADRITVFLEDLDAASGSLSSKRPEEQGMRHAIYSATRLSDQRFVALVTGASGGNDIDARTRVFNGFNTPLLPEVLVCTQVGQEGIDLHRHCRHVIHYDLDWNPARIEQRTGRVDRIGSKTFREREAFHGNHRVFLEIGVPFLAGTYDERMYEELRLRAQIFEVLTGGDFVSENVEGHDQPERIQNDERDPDSLDRFLPLPTEMVDQLRVKLHAWTEGPPK